MKTKNILWIAVLLLIFGSLFGNKTNKVITKKSTIMSISKGFDMPIKKLEGKLNLERSDQNKTLQELNIPVQKIKNIVNQFENNKMEFSWGVVIVGMVVVFLSLLLIGFIISQLQHIENLGKKKEKKSVSNSVSVNTSVGKVTALSDQISANAIVAAVTALHLHVMEIEETNKLLLTWKRTSLNLWRYYYKFKMPNREFSQLKRR